MNNGEKSNVIGVSDFVIKEFDPDGEGWGGCDVAIGETGIAPSNIQEQHGTH